jgi:group I intron endonuclease
MSYIGVTRNVDARWSAHKRTDGFCSYFYNAIKKYGSENFTFEVIAQAKDRDSAIWCEMTIIADRKTKCPNGYNLTNGGDGMHGYKMSEETKRKISEKNKGRRISEEVKKKLSAAGRLRRDTEETKLKRSLSLKGRKFSAETLKKMSEGQKRREKSSPETNEKRRQKMIEIWKTRVISEEAREKMRESGRLVQQRRKQERSYANQ